MSPREFVPLERVERLVARWFPSEARRVEPIAAGVSTPIFRVWHGDEVSYLRLAEEAGENRVAEAKVHALLAARGVPVPAVLRFEPFAPEVGRSAMLTSEVPGLPLSEIPDELAAYKVAIAAGRALAQVNAIPVHGYGWVDHVDADGTLVAEHTVREEWASVAIDAAYAVTEHHLLLPGFERRLEGSVERWARRPAQATAWLAHGDFDTTHSYYDSHHDDGRFTGIIDFGEVRGADPLYDLGHFLLHDTERPPYALFRSLLAGYQEVTPLPPEAHREIREQALAVGVQRLALAHQRRAEEYAFRLIDRVQLMLLDLDQEDWVLVEADRID